MSKSVLVVDDHAETCQLLVLLANRLGYLAESRLSGAEALDYLSVNSVGLVLLDYMMPDMDGLEVLARIRSNDALKSVPVIMHTALSDERNKTTLLNAGARDVLVKSSYGLHRLNELLTQHFCA